MKSQENYIKIFLIFGSIITILILLLCVFLAPFTWGLSFQLIPYPTFTGKIVTYLGNFKIFGTEYITFSNQCLLLLAALSEYFVLSGAFGCFIYGLRDKVLIHIVPFLLLFVSYFCLWFDIIETSPFGAKILMSSPNKSYRESLIYKLGSTKSKSLLPILIEEFEKLHLVKAEENFNYQYTDFLTGAIYNIGGWDFWINYIETEKARNTVDPALWPLILQTGTGQNLKDCVNNSQCSPEAQELANKIQLLTIRIIKLLEEKIKKDDCKKEELLCFFKFNPWLCELNLISDYSLSVCLEVKTTEINCR